MSTWSAALLAAACLHAGFQATVTVLVYPALARVEPERWAPAHEAHSRSITPLVAVVYAVVVVVCLGAVLDDPHSLARWATGVVEAAALLVTAAGAARTHARLGSGRTSALVRRLLRQDRVRLVLALLGVLTAAAAR